MDDIYEDLDNYNDVNAVQELRGENLILKQKLEECTAAMGKLQHDYDGLALEFKKLEINYSSLLKTARAEIERKTQIITSLNIEKDMMVVKAMQNGNNFRRNFYKDKPNLNNTNNTRKNQDNNKNIEESQKSNVDDHTERKDKARLLKQEPVTVAPQENTNRISSLGLVNTCSDKKTEFKENVKHEQKPTPKIVASSIKNRRKSMPGCVQEKNISDDEQERMCPPEKNIKNNKSERNQLVRFPIDRYSNKTSESSSLDDRSSNYQEPPRETSRNRSNRYSDDKYRSREKYDFSHRSRRHISPVHGHKRPLREYHDDNYHKSEHGRYRVLVSPPPDPYHHNNHTSNYHQRRNRELRPNYDRYHTEYDRHRKRYEEKQSHKHRFSNDNDEPSNKRPRIESFGNTSHCHADEDERYTEIELADRVPGLGHTLDLQDTSCQSPDYLHSEAGPVHPVREIMNTALIPLDDPRKFSKKYVLNADVEGATTISTLVGRNVDMIPINKTAWNIERVDIPRALRDHPSHFSDELVHEIYMDVDNPVANMSMESGEIFFNSDKLYSENLDQNNELGNAKESIGLNKPMEEYSKTINVENIQTSTSMKYRIPKIKHDKHTHEENRNRTNLDSHKSVCKSSEENKIDNRTRDSMHETLINTHNKFHSNEGNESIEVPTEGKRGNPSQTTLTDTINVEGDLELSDENSDVESTRQPVIDKTVVQTTENKATEASVAPSNINEINLRQLPDKTENLNSKEINVSETTKETDSKKHKGKKKKSKSKDSKQATDDSRIVQVPEKKSKSKKEKVKPKEIENKFSDLFGDSGSLIMPEDLGIATFVPSFEDAQDAVDLNIKQMVKPQPSNINNVCNARLKTRTENVDNTNLAPKFQGIDIKIACDKDQNVATDNSNQNSLKNCVEKASPEIANIVYENINPDATVYNGNVVKTIIMSTGVQPQFDLERNVEPILEKPVMEINPNAKTNPAINDLNKQHHMKALATSTPQKEFGNILENRLIESSCSRVESLESIPSAVDQSETNTLDLNADVPDVRIFVKRRRKVMKKPCN